MESFFENILFLRSDYIKLDGYKGYIKYIALAIFNLLLKVSIDFLIVVIPAFVIKKIISGAQLPEIIIPSLLLGIITLFFSVTRIYKHKYEFFFRMKEFSLVTDYFLDLPYEKMNSSVGEKYTKNCGQALYTGNVHGTEGLIKNFWNIISNLLAILSFVIISFKLPYYWIVFAIIPSLIKGIFKTKYIIKNKDVNDKRNEYWIQRKYFETVTLDSTAAKDHRLYNLKNILKDKTYELKNKWFKLIKDFQLGLFKYDVLGFILELFRDILCIYLIIELVKNNGSVDDFVLYIGIIFSLSSILNSLFREIPLAVDNNIQVRKYRETFGDKSYFDGSYKQKLGDEPIEVEFNNVSYRYEAKDDYVIKSLNVKINMGENIALVGDNGAGKTTFINLLVGLLKPTEGKILYNGIDIEEISPIERFKRISLVFQESKIFAYTIKENIALENLDKIDMNKVIEVCKKAGIHEKIVSLKNGYDTNLTTFLDKDGIVLSGGENQKLMLARALYRGGDLLILDEPTSALDPIAEANMYKEYLKYSQGKTSIFISHRLSSTQFCNRVLFMKAGQIVQQGTHEELMKLGGEYKEMFDIQAKYYK